MVNWGKLGSKAALPAEADIKAWVLICTVKRKVEKFIATCDWLNALPKGNATGWLQNVLTVWVLLHLLHLRQLQARQRVCPLLPMRENGSSPQQG